MKWLLDTCVISELVSKQPDKKVVKWIDGIDADRLYLSVITIGEIRKGIEKLPESKRRENLQVWLTEDLFTRFSGRIVALDTDILLVWGILTGRLEDEGKKMSAMDSLIAATALHGDFILVTRNETDFTHANIRIQNPWQG